jgi:cytochrome c1
MSRTLKRRFRVRRKKAPPLQGVVDTTNMASRKDIRQGYRQEKRDVRELEKELRQTQNTLQRMANKMTPEQTKQYQTKVAQLQNQINQSAR